MAKATAEEAARTRQKIIDTALEITLDSGFEDATLGNLAKRIGMSRSGITCHFAYKTDIAAAIEPLLSKMLLEPLCFDSPELFYESWKMAVETKPEFRSVLKAFGPIVPSDVGSAGLVKRIDGNLKDSMDIVYMAIGYATVRIAHIERQLAISGQSVDVLSSGKDSCKSCHR